MTREDFLILLRQCPIVASVQASPGSPLQDSGALLKLGKASLSQGVQVLRLEGIPTIGLVRAAVDAPVIGLIKRSYEGSEIYITPTLNEVRELIGAGCEVIALDATPRRRPLDEDLRELIQEIHEADRLALADCDSATSMDYAISCGADLLSTTLSGYTPDSGNTTGPDLELVRWAAANRETPVLAEGRYQEPWQARAALHAGAVGVVIGGALNDPVKQTQRFVNSLARAGEVVAAVDIGGTWMRLGVFSPEWRLTKSERLPTPKTHKERLSLIEDWCRLHDLERVGISTGGTVDPQENLIWESKKTIAENENASVHVPGLTINALNDGLATAWAHACHARFVGLSVATLALGTGVGCGFVRKGELLMGARGQYPRLNDLSFGGRTFEEVLGGLSFGPEPTIEQQAAACEAAREAIRTLRAMWFPDVIVLCGGVGLAPWLSWEEEEISGRQGMGWVWPEVVRSPFGEDAGLYGAAALALFPAPR